LRYAACGRSAVVAKCAVPVPKEEADGFARVLVAHPTTHVADSATGDDGRTAGPSIQSVFRGLVDDPERTRQICDDVAAGVRQGRNCLVLSQWTGHVANLADALRADGMELLVLQGGMGKKARGLVMRSLEGPRPGDGVVVVATGSFLGEGFDCAALDTLFLAFPIAFKGRLVQYVGRVLRPVEGKTRVEVHDYGERQAKTGGTRVIVSLMPGDNVADQLALTSPRTIDARAMGQVTACVESGLPPLDERASP
jgi:hypothetical protein